LDELKMSEIVKITEFRNLHNLLNPEHQSVNNNSNGNNRRNKSVYTGMFRKVIEEIDKKDLNTHELSLC
jgi:hypothetical protein